MSDYRKLFHHAEHCYAEEDLARAERAHRPLLERAFFAPRNTFARHLQAFRQVHEKRQCLRIVCREWRDKVIAHNEARR